MKSERLHHSSQVAAVVVDQTIKSRTLMTASEAAVYVIRLGTSRITDVSSSV